MTFSAFTLGCFRIAVLLLAGMVGYSVAQAPAPSPPAQTCEQQLEQAQGQIIQLRKANAQSEFRAASVEEQALSLSKQLAAEKAKGSAVKSEAKPK